MEFVPGYLLFVGGVGIIVLVVAYRWLTRPILLPNEIPQDAQKVRSNLKKEAEEIVILANAGDKRAIHAVNAHFKDQENSEYQGLIEMGPDGRVAFVDSSRKPSWYIEADDDGELLVTKTPTNPAPLVWEPSHPIPLEKVK